MTNDFPDTHPGHDPSAADGPGLLASGYFWVGGILSSELWVALALWAIELR